MIQRPIIILIIFALGLSLGSYAQIDVRPYIEKGNEFMNHKQYKNAAVTFKHACILDTTSFDAWYNFGVALYHLEKYTLASNAFNKSLNFTKDKSLKNKSFHNLGNCAIKQEKYDNAINYFQKSLLNNPKDSDSRYNLVYAQKMKAAQNKDNNKPKDSKNKEQKPSAFALSCKQKADALLSQYKYSEALKVMTDGLKVDKTVATFNDYMVKLQKIVSIIEMK